MQSPVTWTRTSVLTSRTVPTAESKFRVVDSGASWMRPHGTPAETGGTCAAPKQRADPHMSSAIAPMKEDICVCIARVEAPAAAKKCRRRFKWGRAPARLSDRRGSLISFSV